MKIKSNNKKVLTNSQTKLAKLKLIKARLYKNLLKKTISVEDIYIRLKKALHIIYKYHTKSKKILFVGFPSNQQSLLQNLFEKTRHVTLPNSIWMNGILTNPYSSFQYLAMNSQNMNRKHCHLLFKLRYKVDLIVIIESELSESIVKESRKTSIPVITLNSNLGVRDFDDAYMVPGYAHSANKYEHRYFLHSLIFSVLKKAQKEKSYNHSRKRLTTTTKFSGISRNTLKKS